MAKNSKLVPRAKELRKNMTLAEEVLWKELRMYKINNFKFRRQMPLIFGEYHFVVDFCCVERKLIIEVDGSIHYDQEVKEYDELREEILQLAGYKIIRFKNNEILYNIDQVLSKIKFLF